jgi:hypothetical protein
VRGGERDDGGQEKKDVGEGAKKHSASASGRGVGRNRSVQFELTARLDESFEQQGFMLHKSVLLHGWRAAKGGIDEGSIKKLKKVSYVQTPEK